MFFGSTNRPQFSIYWHESFFKIKIHPLRWVYFLGKCSEVPRSIFFRRIQNLVNNFFNLNNPVNGPFFLRATDHSFQDIYMNLFAKVGYTDVLWIIFRKKFWSTSFYFFRRVLDRSTGAFWTNYAQNQEINWLVSSTYRPQFSRYQHESFCNV